eukprot:6069820-Amphidinium_carterae.2
MGTWTYVHNLHDRRILHSNLSTLSGTNQVAQMVTINLHLVLLLPVGQSKIRNVVMTSRHPHIQTHAHRILAQPKTH